MGNILQDLRYGARMLLKQPGFTLIASLTLALGIGANAAIFSVVNAVLLRPLPYPDSEQLAWVWLDNRREGIHEDITSYPNFVDWRAQNRVFEGLAGVRDGQFNLTGVGEPEELRGANVSTNFFDLLRVKPALGRGFSAEEEQEGRDGVVVLGHALWQRRFGGEPKLLGQTLSLNGRSFTVVGIMPPGFQFPAKVELWKPLVPAAQTRTARDAFWLPVIGRLKPGVTRAQAQTEMALLATRLEQQYRQELEGYGVNVVLLHDQLVGRVRPALQVLLGAVGFVLLIACANVANLLLARSAARQKEMAVRAALGAGRGRLVGQLLTESVLLAVIGGVAGVLWAVVGLKALLALAPPDLPRVESIGLDRTVLLFTMGLSLLVGVLFGLAPARQASKLDLNEVLKEGGRSQSSGVGGQRTRTLLVVSEIALALVLLIGAGLLLKSSWRLQQVNPGFNPDQVLKGRVIPPRAKYQDAASVTNFYQQLLERLRALPGVQGAEATTSVLMRRIHSSSIFVIEGRPVEPAGQRPELPIDSVTPGYFRLLGIPLLKGRVFDERDTRETQRVALINEAMARRFWPNEDPLGKRFQFGDSADPQAPRLTIVGVVADAKRQGLDAQVRIECFLPHAQSPARAMELVVRTGDNPLALARTVRETIWSLDKDLPLSEIQTVEQMLNERIAPRRFNLLLFGLFAAVALVLAAVGIYGVMSYTVAQRTHELGIRVALGAQTRDVLRLVIGQGMALALLGVALGLLAAYGLTRWLATLLYEVSATDTLTFALLAALLLAVALLACFIPARRATRVDPIIALRYE